MKTGKRHVAPRLGWGDGYLRYLTETEIDDFCWALLSEIEGDVGGVKSNFEDAVNVFDRMYHSRESASDSWPLRSSLRDAERRAHHDALRAWHTVECGETHSRFVFEVSKAKLDAAARLRVIRARLDALDPVSLETLARVYLRPGHDLHEWEELGSIVLRLPTAAREHVRSGDRRSLPAWLASIKDRATWAHVVTRLKQEADARLRAASEAWTRTWTVGDKERRRKVVVWG